MILPLVTLLLLLLVAALGRKIIYELTPGFSRARAWLLLLGGGGLVLWVLLSWLLA